MKKFFKHLLPIVILANLGTLSAMNLTQKEADLKLICACKAGDTYTALELLKAGATVEDAASDHLPLHHAVQGGHMTCVKLLLSRGAHFQLKSSRGFTPLHVAAQYGHCPLIRLFLSMGESCNVAADGDCKPLHLAVQGEHEEAVKLLLEQGAEIEKESVKMSVLKIAMGKGNKKIIALLKKHGAEHNKDLGGFTNLHVAAANGHQDLVIKLLEEEGIPLDEPAKNGATPLLNAANNGHLETVRALLEKGAAINAQAANGYTALCIAVVRNYEEIAIALLEKGADPNICSLSSVFPLHSAAEKGNIKILKLLLEHNADVNAAFSDGTTALHIAARNGRQEVCLSLQKWLVRKKLCESSQAAYERLFTALCCLKRINIDIPKEVRNRILHMIGFEMLCAAAYKSSKKTLFQSLLKGAQEISGAIPARELLHNFSRSCLNDAYTLTCKQGGTAAVYAQIRGHEALGNLLKPGTSIEPELINQWIAEERTRHGNIAIPAITQAEINVKRCLACNKAGALKRCSICKTAFFCDQTCQKKAWAAHKKECKSTSATSSEK